MFRGIMCVTGLPAKPAGPVTGHTSSLLVAIQAAPARRFGVPGYAAGFRSRGNDGSMACDVMFRLAVVRRNVASDSASRMGLDDWHDRVDQALQFVGTDG